MLSIVIPALNEEKTIGICVRKALNSIKKLGVEGEVIVADNGSEDDTERVAIEAGARIVRVKEKGYGAAYRHSIPYTEGNFIIIGDGDDSYNFNEIGPFYRKLEQGYEFVIGNRFKGRIEKGAMPFLHRYFGTPVITGIMNLFFKVGIGDTNCGMRAFTRSAYESMELSTSGMEFATEMAIKASLVGLKMCEIPCNLYRDKRDHPPHLNTWSDGWRYLRFMLLYSPVWTYLVPGISLMVIGIVFMLGMFLRDCIDPQFLSGFLKNKYFSLLLLPLLVGSQILSFGVIAHSLMNEKRYRNFNKTIIKLLDWFKLEKGLMVSVLLSSSGALIMLFLVLTNYFFSPVFSTLVRNNLSIIAISLIIIGIQVFYTSFLLSHNTQRLL